MLTAMSLVPFVDSLMRFLEIIFQKTIAFIKELSRMIPKSEPMWRKNTSFKKIVKQAIENGYTDVVIVNEDNRVPNGLVVSHLPNGPTAHFKLSNVKITKDIKVSVKNDPV
jgi:ribosome production factor 1